MAKKKPVVQLEPFRQKSSIIHEVFQAAKSGVDEKTIIKIVNKRKGNAFTVLRTLKSGSKGNFLWDVDDSDGWLKVTNIRSAPKS